MARNVENATMAILKKNPPTSAVQPIGGESGCVFLMAGNAKIKEAHSPMIGGSTFLSRNQIVVIRVRMVKERIHMVPITNYMLSL
jgi:hypothetical protein